LLGDETEYEGAGHLQSCRLCQADDVLKMRTYLSNLSKCFNKLFLGNKTIMVRGKGDLQQPRDLYLTAVSRTALHPTCMSTVPMNNFVGMGG